MIRTEAYLDGRLVKEFDMVNIGPTADKPYNLLVDGRYRWLLDGAEITEAEAMAALANAEQVSPTQAEIDAGADVMAEIVDDLIDEARRQE